MPITINRKDVGFKPNPERVICRLHLPGEEPRALKIIQKILDLSDDEVNYLLENDIERVIKVLSSEYPWFNGLDDARKDAMIDIGFNLGATKLRGFRRALTAMEEADYNAASDEFLDSKWARQVGSRSVELTEMIRTGEYL